MVIKLLEALGQGHTVPTLLNVRIWTDSDYDLSVWLCGQKQFFCKPLKRRVRIVFMDMAYVTLELLKQEYPAMLYTLILTIYLTGQYNDAPTVAQSSTPGFTSQQACTNAGKVAQAGAVKGMGRYDTYAIITYQCAPLSL